MPQSFGWFTYAPRPSGFFAPSNQAVLHQEAALGDRPLATSPWFAAASAAAIGGLTLIEPRSLGLAARAAYRITTAALTGAYTAAIMPAGVPAGMPARYTDAPCPPMLAVPVDAGLWASAGLVTGGVTMGLADQFEALDARMVDWLTDRGVSRPRWWLAGVGVAMVAAGWASDRVEARSLQRDVLDGAQEDTGHEDLAPAEPAVVALLDALIQPGIPGAEALRVQLESAQQRDAGAGFMTDAYLVAGQDTPRIAPRTQLWPVKGRFTREGVVFEIELQIHEGRLESLSLVLAEEMYGPDSEADHSEAIDSLSAWPEPSELELITERADPLP